jgi:hypothetical protein
MPTVFVGEVVMVKVRLYRIRAKIG